MDFKHVPVLYEECMENLRIIPDGIYADGTLGGGGHSMGIGRKLGPEGTLIGIDRDTDALEAAGKRLEPLECRKIFVHDNYSNIKEILEEHGIPGLNGALLDIGVSSFQLDNADRGFSYMHDAPLDMRMNRDDSFSAYDVVNGYDKRQLTEIIKNYGEERWASRISDFIIKKKGNRADRDDGRAGGCDKGSYPGISEERRSTPCKTYIPGDKDRSERRA
ncbi:MAG: 16S rRNA (cytosine(1402)-N(4))-methyltransferase RsmH [Anaerovoracaceae bacterium]